MDYQGVAFLRKTHYANTPFEVDEFYDSDAEFESAFSCARSDRSRLTLGSFDSLFSDQSYLILDFEDGELSPCITEHGYGITHPDEQIIMSLDCDRDSYAASESTWYDDADDANSEYNDDASISTGQVPSMTTCHSSSGEDETDGIATPSTEDEEDEPQQDENAIAELRASLTRHLPPSASGSAYFEMLVTEALSSLDQALREAPTDCFEEMCWESQDSAEDESSPVSPRRKKSKQYTRGSKLIDVPEEVQAPFEWEWKADVDGYKFSIPSPSQDIGFSPRAVVKRPQHSQASFKRFARHFRFARDSD